MKCEVIKSGVKIAGPLEYDPVVIKSIVQSSGGSTQAIPARLTSAFKISYLTIKPVKEIKPALLAGQRLSTYTRTETDHEVIYSYAVADRAESELRQQHLTQLSTLHDQYEQSRFNYRGVLIKADLEARINAKATLDLFREGKLTQAEWRGKVKDNSVEDSLELNKTAYSNAGIPITSVAEAEGLYGAIVRYLGIGFAVRTSLETMVNGLSRDQLIAFDASSAFNAAVQAANG